MIPFHRQALALVCIAVTFYPVQGQEEKSGAVPSKPDRAQLEAQFAKATADRTAAAPNSQQRANAARDAMQSASDIAWMDFDAGKFTEASNWFAKSAELTKEQIDNSRGYWEDQLQTSVVETEGKFGARIKDLESQLAAADEAKKKELRSMIDSLSQMMHVMRYNAITMLEGIARESNDTTSLLKLTEAELAIRRQELDYLEKAKAPEKDLNRKKVEVATAMERMAAAQAELALFDQAEKNYLEALTIRRALPETLAERKVETTLANLGAMYSNNVGDYAKARDYYSQALASMEASAAARRKALDEDYWTDEQKATMSPEELEKHKTSLAENREMTAQLDLMSESSALSELGGVIQESGDLKGALSYYKRALELIETLPPTSGQANLIRATFRARSLGDMAAIHAASGEVELALKEVTEAIAIKRSIGNDKSTAGSLLQAADLAFSQGDMRSARNNVEQARQIFAGARNLKNVASATRFLAVIARDEDKLEEAASRADEALLLARKTANLGLVTSCARTYASILVKQKKLDEARKLIEEARAADAKTGSVTDRIATLGISGELLEAQGNNDKALVDYEEAIKLVEGMRSTAASEAAFADVKSNYRPYERIVRVLIKLGRSTEAFDYLNRAKSKKLQDAMPASSLKTADKQEQEKIDRAAALETKQKVTESQIAAQEASASPDEAAIKNLKLVAASNEAEYREVVEDIKDANPDWEKSMTVKPSQLVETQSQIPDGVTFLQYAPLGDKLYIFVVTNRSVKIYTPEVKPEDLKKKILALRRQITSGESGAALNKSLFVLYDMLIAPIEAELASVKTIAFIPNQILFYLPLQALAKKQADGKPRYLIEDKEIVYLTAADVMRAVQPPSPGKATGGMVAMGNPTGAELPAAEVEVKSIASVFPGTDVLSGAGVTKDAINDQSLFDKRIVHFATHGILNSAIPRESYLQLASGGAPGAERLTVKEIWRLPMKKVEIVTLSACETALGSKDPDGGEITTLAEAFATAKVRSVVASLWSVGDESTKEFMVAFYKQLASGASKPAALQSAMISLMKNPKYAMPLYWSPFVLMGDWR